VWYENILKENEEEKFKKIKFYYTKYSTGESIPETDRKLLHLRKDIHHLIKNPYKVDDEFSYYYWVRKEYPQYYKNGKAINDSIKKKKKEWVLFFFPFNSVRRRVLKRIYMLLCKGKNN
jgi:hypothetical protein